MRLECPRFCSVCQDKHFLTLNFFVAECQFGKQAKELGSTWFADLGPPFGVMYCIKCECIPVSGNVDFDHKWVGETECRDDIMQNFSSSNYSKTKCLRKKKVVSECSVKFNCVQ